MEQLQIQSFENEDVLSDGEGVPVKKTSKGLKRPRSELLLCEEDMDFDSDHLDDQPDLKNYFDKWDMPEKHQIIMCRAYASYLSAKQHGEKKKKN